MAKHTFKPGIRCKNHFGWYTVQSEPKNGKMKVKYDNGETKDILAVLELTNLRESQDELQDVLRQEQGDIRGSFKHWLRNDDYYIAIGFLAANTYICFHTPVDDKGTISALYKEFHNTELSDTTEGLFLCNGKEWSNEFRVNFPKALFANIPNLPFESLRLENQSDVCQVNHNKWGRELIELGFELGNHHNVEMIRSRIPTQYLESFQLGYEVAKDMNLSKVEKSLIGAHTPVEVAQKMADFKQDEQEKMAA